MSDLARTGGAAPARPSSAPPPSSATPAAPPPDTAAPRPAVPAPARLRMSSLSAQARAADVVRATERLDAAPPADGADASTRILEDLRRFLEGAREAFKGNEPLHWTELQRAIERVVRSLDASGELFWLANSPTVPEGQDYLAVHQARVAILAVRIGMTTGLTGRRLVELGMGAALIDVGLWQLSAGALRRLGSLSAEEQALYRAHPQLAAERLRRWGAPSERIIETVLQHHEREQGQGFPDGLEGAAVCPEAKIVGLADVYVGLTAPPSPRPGLPPHEAIREIVRGKDEAFSPALIKALLSDISVFPPGTMVRLNTGETGRVVAINRNQPLRPRIEVVDGKSGPLPTPKLVNLAEAPFLYITGPVSGTAR